MKLPWTIKVGDQVSATWMNLVVSALKELDDMQKRRRILRGVGYTVSESPGGTSLTIERQAFPRSVEQILNEEVMPFDVSLVYKAPEQESAQAEDGGEEEGAEEEQQQPHINVAGGRVFLPGNEYAEIPDKTDWQVSAEEDFPQYVILTLTRDGTGDIKYRYEMGQLPGTKVSATEETENAAS